MPTRSALTTLSARSVVLSLVLGAHPRELTTAALVRAGAHVGIAAPTVRVALTRAVASGELERGGSGHRLGSRLLERRRRHQDRPTAAWDGTWETVVVVGTGRPGTERAALRSELTAARLGELREGVWMRPANLGRPTTTDGGGLQTFRSTPAGDPSALAASLWDLTAWATEAVTTLDTFASTTGPAERLALAARLVRHLATDPLLPLELCPAEWPADRAHATYAGYQRELDEIANG